MFATKQHVEVEAIWLRIVAACRNPNRACAKTDLAKTITLISVAAPTALIELITLGRTLKRRGADVLAYGDHTRANAQTPARSTCWPPSTGRP